MSDDVIYLSLLVFSIAFGAIYQRIDGKITKQWVGTIVGLTVICIPSGIHILHPIVITIFTILLLQFGNKRHIHGIAFICLFFYLFFFRLCGYMGLPPPPAHTNAIQMMLTLKLVGLCLEVHETWKKQRLLKKVDDIEEKTKLEMELKYESVDPSLLDVVHYAFSYVGALTGPYYKFRVFDDYLNGGMAPPDQIGSICWDTLTKRIKYLPLYIAMYFLASYIFPLTFATSNEIYDEYSILYRIWYMTPIFFAFRMRIYTGFILSECVCIMAGLGMYPSSAKAFPGKGPSNYAALEEKKEDSEFDFETIHNINEWESDFNPTVRGGIRSWNMTVQYWLVVNVYKRLTMAKPLKEALTMLTSSFWHGVHSGYYLSMLTVPFIVAVEDYFEKRIRRNICETNQKVYDFFSWFVKMQHFAYMGMAFLLLNVNTTVYYWRSIGFLNHGIIAILHAIAQFINLITFKIEKKLKKARATTVLGDSRLRVVKSANEEGSKPKLE